MKVLADVSVNSGGCRKAYALFVICIPARAEKGSCAGHGKGNFLTGETVALSVWERAVLPRW